MLPTFENHTEDLNEYELKVLVPVFIAGFASKVGKQNAVTNKEIVAKLSGRYEISDVRVRKIISHIRTNWLVPGLVASSNGYYITDDPAEVKKYIDSLDGREMKIRQVKQEFKDYLNRLLNSHQQTINYE